MGEGWRAVKKCRDIVGSVMTKDPNFDAEAARLARLARLAAALRANLARRKARERSEPAAESETVELPASGPAFES